MSTYLTIAGKTSRSKPLINDEPAHVWCGGSRRIGFVSISMSPTHLAGAPLKNHDIEADVEIKRAREIAIDILQECQRAEEAARKTRRTEDPAR